MLSPANKRPPSMPPAPSRSPRRYILIVVIVIQVILFYSYRSQLTNLGLSDTQTQAPVPTKRDGRQKGNQPSSCQPEGAEIPGSVKIGAVVQEGSDGPASSVIPRHIMYAAGTDIDEIPGALYANIRATQVKNPGHKIVFYNHGRIRKYLKEHTNMTVVDAFDSIESPTLRVQLFKYIFLCNEGGLAVPLTGAVVVELDKLDPAWNAERKLLVSKDAQIALSPKGNPFTCTVAEGVTDRMVRRLYGNSFNDLAGVGLLLTAITRRMKWNTRVRREKALLSVLKRPNCAIDLVAHESTVLVELGRGLREHVKLADASQDDTKWKGRKIFFQDLPSNPERVDGDQEARNICPFGQTENTGYVPVPVPEEDRVAYDFPHYQPPLQQPSSGAKRLIPRRMMQTGQFEKVPIGMLEAINITRGHHQDYEHYYYTDATARQFILKHTNETYLEVFDTFIPGAFKADFFRYVWLYVMGGVYIDIDEYPFTPIPLRNNDTFVSAKDIPRNAAYNAFMASTPQHPVLVTVLRDIVNRVLKRTPCSDPIAAAGPLALGQAIRSVLDLRTDLAGNQDLGDGIRLWHVDKKSWMCTVGTITENNERRISTRYVTYKREMSWYTKKTHYWDYCRAQTFLEPIPVPKTDSQTGQELTEQQVNESREAVFISRVCNSKMTKEQFRSRPLGAPSKAVSVPYGPGPLEEMVDDGVIPQRIMFFSATNEVPEGMWTSVQSVVANHPKFDIEFYNETSAEKFIAFHCSKAVQELYKRAPTWEDRSHLFAILYMMKRGGVYVRIGVVATAHFYHFDKELFVTKDTHNSALLSFDVLASRPGMALWDKTVEQLLTVASLGAGGVRIFMSAQLVKLINAKPFGPRSYKMADQVYHVLFQRPPRRMCADNEIGFDMTSGGVSYDPPPNDEGLGQGEFSNMGPTFREDLAALPKIWGIAPESLFVPKSMLGWAYGVVANLTNVQTSSVGEV